MTVKDIKKIEELAATDTDKAIEAMKELCKTGGWKFWNEKTINAVTFQRKRTIFTLSIKSGKVYKATSKDAYYKIFCMIKEGKEEVKAVKHEVSTPSVVVKEIKGEVYEATLVKIADAQPMGEYTKTSVDYKKEGAEIKLISIGSGKYVIDVKDHVMVDGKGVKAFSVPGRFEVTRTKYNALSKRYNCITDF